MSRKLLVFNISIEVSSSNHQYVLLAYLFFGMVGLVKVGFEAIEIFNMVCRLSKVGPEKNQKRNYWKHIVIKTMYRYYELDSIFYIIAG